MAVAVAFVSHWMTSEGRDMPDGSSIDPVQLLKEDHEKMRAIFDDFEATESAEGEKRVAKEGLLELDVHAGIEEETFYPAFRAEIEGEESEEMINEAEEEHHVVHVLIDELRDMLSGNEDDERLEAKFTVLMENVRHHMEEEENEMLPKAEQLGEERLAELGEEMAVRKKELEQEFREAAG
jgi:hemerythrin-like domain-containing protein